MKVDVDFLESDVKSLDSLAADLALHCNLMVQVYLEKVNLLFLIFIFLMEE
jgi:hypothetical protein